jgi:hypothetical protein
VTPRQRSGDRGVSLIGMRAMQAARAFHLPPRARRRCTAGAEGSRRPQPVTRWRPPQPLVGNPRCPT